MSTAVRTAPPGALLICDRIALTKDNLGCHFTSFPHVPAQSGVYDTSWTFYEDMPNGLSNWYGALDAVTNTGWIRTFHPNCTELWNGTNASPNGTLSAKGVTAFLRMLDFWYRKGVKVLWQARLFTVKPAWVAATAYSAGAKVVNGGNYYLCTVGGTSAGSGGPSGTGTGIADNTVTWDWISANYPDGWNQDLTLSGAETNWINFLTALFTSTQTSPLGYTMANHPALRAFEMGNEVDTVPAATAARCVRIWHTVIQQYRTVNSIEFGLNVASSSRGFPVKDWTTGSAVSLFGISCGSPADDGTGKIMANYAEGWSHHLYGGGAYDTTSEVRTVGNGLVALANNTTLGAAIAHTTGNYWYGLAATGGGAWHNSTLAYLPRFWNTESDVSGQEVLENSGGFGWGQLHPDERKWRFAMWFLTTLLCTTDGSGNVGTSFYYSLDSAFTYSSSGLTITSASQAPNGRARLVLSGALTGGNTSYGVYDDFVVYAPTGWTALGITAASPYKRFVGQKVVSGTVDLLDSSPDSTIGSPPSDVRVYMIRWLYLDPATWQWFTGMVTSGQLTVSVIVWPKVATTDTTTNFGIAVQAGDQRWFYTDRYGVLRRW